MRITVKMLTHKGETVYRVRARSEKAGRDAAILRAESEGLSVLMVMESGVER